MTQRCDGFSATFLNNLKIDEKGISGDEDMMLAILAIVTILAIWGTLKNRRLGNKVGMVIGGLFSIALVGITVLAALFDFGIISA